MTIKMRLLAALAAALLVLLVPMFTMWSIDLGELSPVDRFFTIFVMIPAAFFAFMAPWEDLR